MLKNEIYLNVTTEILNRPNRKPIGIIIKKKTLFNKSNNAKKVKYLTHSFSLSKPHNSENP